MQKFDGIAEKLVRANENIDNLDREISLFFEEGDYAVLPQNDREVLLEAIQYHKGRPIPPRFAVLAGEIVHHLRSCFDHIVWQFSTGAQKNNMPIDFPVFEKEPIKRRDTERFEGKIQRITEPDVRMLIKRLQPYKSPDPIDDPLLIIHNFDITDKHKELAIVVPKGLIVLPAKMKVVVDAYKREHPEFNAAQVAHHFQNYGTVRPTVAFRNFGRRENQPVIQGLTNLFHYTVNAINGFKVL